MSEQSGSRREPDDPMARQSGATVEDVQPVAPSEDPDETTEDGPPTESVEPPTVPGRDAHPPTR
jgi:hypothetical protein